MKINYNISEFRKDFVEKFPGFYLRIREDSNDIAYYKGIKAFEVIKESENIINIFFPINTYKCSTTNVKKNKNINEDLKTLLLPMTSFFEFSISKISFKKSGYYEETVAVERLNRFKNHVLNLIDVDVEKIIKKLNQVHYKDEIVISLEFNKIKNINDILDIQYHFINDMKITDENKKSIRRGMDLICKDIRFDFSISDKLDDDKIKIHSYEIFEDFKEVVKKAIDNYENQTSLNKEKKYQHQFMLGACDNSQEIYPFEEEYYIKEKDSESNDSSEDEKNGRIDSILFKLEEKVLTDVYLIELKVNEDVVAGDNGVLTHLDDIKNLINKTNLKKQNDKDFFYKLKKRINYRLHELYGFELVNNDFSVVDYSVHFYTIVSYTNPIKDNKLKVEKIFKYFNTKEGVNILIDNKCLNKAFTNKSIYDVIDDFKNKNKCKLRFIFDEKEWNEKTDEFNPSFKDVTDIYFKGLNNEQS